MIRICKNETSAEIYGLSKDAAGQIEDFATTPVAARAKVWVDREHFTTHMIVRPVWLAAMIASYYEIDVVSLSLGAYLHHLVSGWLAGDHLTVLDEDQHLPVIDPASDRERVEIVPGVEDGLDPG